MEPKENKHIALDNGDDLSSSTSHSVILEQGRGVQQDVSSSREAPFTTPTISLTTSDSCVSNYSDFSVDVSPHDSLSPEDGEIESGHYDPGSKAANENVNNSSLLASENALQQSDVVKDNQHKSSNGFVNENRDLDSHDRISDGSQGVSPDEAEENSPAYYDQNDIWIPPEAENELDNMENSMATLDDEDEECANGDASEWAMPSSLNSFEDGVPSSHRSKEDKQKAIEEVMNGKFKNLVSQLLKKVGVENCDSKEENWVDTVTLLAWQAASFVKPEAADGKAMDPAGYVKIKCIAAGSRSDSRLIKGLVFKKHAAHKHMATKHKNPRLLLVQGDLEPSSSSGLSSFSSLMAEAKDNLTDLVENLQACHPNVILVEKSASRDVLQKVLVLEVTLVLDMKLHRLERVARCTGSPILSSDKPFSQKLKHCDSLYFEKIVEEHAVVGEGGKKPSKTLMFLEGCPTRLGCTILLKGSHSEELKKIKCVVQCAVVMAYHFLLETSFLVDQEAMFSTIAYHKVADNSLAGTESISVSSKIGNVLHTEYPNADGASIEIDVPISNSGDEGSSPVQESGLLGKQIPSGSHYEKSSDISPVMEIATSNGHNKASHNMQRLETASSAICHEPHMTSLSTASSSIHDVLEKVSFVSPSTFEDMSTYMDLNWTGPQFQSTVSIPVSPSEEVPEKHGIDVNNSYMDDMSPHNDTQTMSTLSEVAGKLKDAVEDGEDCIKTKEEINNLLDSESILVLMSSRNASKGSFCEQSHFSHIKFYRHFDVPLGKFLKDNLFNQTVPCKTCSELPEAHFYYYAHHSKQLTIIVKKLGMEMRLPGESEGKLWMWSRCGKCAPNKEKATKRVLISTAARGLSFGKFLELSFSSHSSFNRLSSCGHSFQKDFLYFFGLGSMVAMFHYSLVRTYSVSVPSQKLEFNSSINGDWLKQEIEDVYAKGLGVFTEVANYLKKLESQFAGQSLALNGSSSGFNDIVDMLKLERSEFEEKIMDTRIENSVNTVHKLLILNRLRLEILLEGCMWERRLQSLISSLSTLPPSSVTNDVAQSQLSSSDSNGKEAEGSHTAAHEVLLGQTLLKGHISGEQVEGTQKLTDKETQKSADTEDAHSEGTLTTVANRVEGHTSLNDHTARELTGVNTADSDHTDAVFEGEENISHGDQISSNCTDVEIHIEEVDGAELSRNALPNEGSVCEEQGCISSPTIEGTLKSPASEDLVTSVSLLPEPDRNANPSSVLHSNGGSTQIGDTLLSNNLSEARSIPIKGDKEDAADEEVSETVTSPPLSKSGTRDWMWSLFSQMREERLKDLQKFGHLPKFLLLQSLDVLPKVSQVKIEEGSRLHIPIGDGDYIVSDFDGEISSSVACALALMKDLTPPVSDSDENATLKRAASEPLRRWGSSSFLDPDVIHSATSMSFAEHFPSFDGSNYLQSPFSYGQVHPEVNLGAEKYPMKGKYSVVINYANEFRAFREQCCPSELDYIASLSRCKIWDAKGGKSKSLFAKTLDERLIIKEIKKTEFESFMKFATGYFQHMKDSVESGNQTCLAKILGIYQVTIRNPKSGKESKHDLMVMENLSFGRNVTRQYDLKGALHSRFTVGDGSDDVLLDQNFVNDMHASPMYVGKRAKRLLQRAVWNDTTFLHSINVMDYSLLVGVDQKRQELLCGIIDYLRQYTWDKQLETWVKSSLVMPKNVTPTIVSPEMYKKRFRKFMDTHFMTVPDRWCSQRSSNPCKLCGIQSDDPSQTTEKREEELNGFNTHD